jgi:hypothetical protein
MAVAGTSTALRVLLRAASMVRGQRLEVSIVKG